MGPRCLPPETTPNITIHNLLPGASQPLSTNSDPDLTKVAKFHPSSMTCQLLPPGLTEQSSQGFDPCEAATHSLLPAANATTPCKLETLGHAQTLHARSRESMSLPREKICCHVSWRLCHARGRKNCEKNINFVEIGSRRSRLPCPTCHDMPCHAMPCHAIILFLCIIPL